MRLVRINDIDMENTVDRGLGYYSTVVVSYAVVVKLLINLCE